jgi:hypothetical protein
MLRTFIRIVVAAVFVLGLGAGSAMAGDAATEPLPFLAGGCPQASAPAPLPQLDLQTLSPAAAECLGCSVHNCYYKRVGTGCLINGARGRCTASNWCPEVRETSCTCEPV